ncbi:GTP cyclohydrolase I, type 1 [Hydrogenimonas sp.]|nr:GTP cyclohydrolase I, type 1 [Hydrogenimonas sp.]
MVNIFARRLQIQEQMTEQIADAIIDTIHPKGWPSSSKPAIFAWR